MGWHRPDEDSRADNERDLAKHEPRPGEKDYVPHRLDVEIPTAVDIAFMVKALPLMKGAEVIEQYLKETADRARMDAVRAGAGR